MFFLRIHLNVHFFSSSYDEEADKVNQYQRLNLEGLEKIEIGEKLSLKGEVKVPVLSLSHPTLPKSLLNSFSVIF